LFGLVLPDNCRLCDQPLAELTRYPVCRACLGSVEPMAAEHFCVSCRAPFLNPRPLDENGQCALCRSGQLGFDGAYSFGTYDGPLRSLIHLFKYGRIHTLAQPLGRLLVRALPLDRRFDLVVPVPMHWRRRWQRGFNQAELLARVVSRRAGLPLCHPVRRRRHTGPQAELTAAGRRLNVSASFEVRRRSEIQGRHLLLIDDVLTTGATAGACALALKLAGAASVTVLTVARADRRQWTESLTVARGAGAPHSFALGAS